MRHCCTIVLGSCLLATHAAGAQTLRIDLRDSASTARVTGALVAVVDATGRTVAERVSDARGAMVVRLPSAGSYRVRVRRIGRVPFVSAPREVGIDAEVAMSLTLASARQVLPRATVTADAGRVCGREPGDRDRVGVLWEQIATALRVAVLTREDTATSPMLRVREVERVLGGLGTVLETRLLADTKRRGRAFTAIDPDSLARRGFVRKEADGGFRFYAPDDGVLTSAAFLRTHCFSAPLPDSASALAELQFRPARAGRRPDVEGSIFVDTATGAPRYIEYRYVMPKGFLPAPAPNAGGRVQLERLADDSWIVSGWLIRMPLWGETDQGTRVIVAGWQEHAGEARPVDERLIRPAVLPEARGVAIDLVLKDEAGNPAADVLAGLDVGDSYVRTDSLGRARFVVVDTGTFGLHLRRIGLASVDTLLTFTQHGTTSVTLVMKRVQTLAAVQVSVNPALVAVGFSRRKALGMGWFLDSAAVRRRSALNALQLLQGFPKIEIFRVPQTNDSAGRPPRMPPRMLDEWTPNNEIPVIRSSMSLSAEGTLANGGGWCMPAIIIDGRRGRVSELKYLSADDIIGLEFYPRASTTPSEYRLQEYGDECGAVLVWTVGLR